MTDKRNLHSRDWTLQVHTLIKTWTQTNWLSLAIYTCMLQILENSWSIQTLLTMIWLHNHSTEIWLAVDTTLCLNAVVRGCMCLHSWRHILKIFLPASKSWWLVKSDFLSFLVFFLPPTSASKRIETGEKCQIWQISLFELESWHVKLDDQDTCIVNSGRFWMLIAGQFSFG